MNEEELLAAERRGRALAWRFGGNAGSAWLIDAAPGPAGEALLAAGRLARRFGADVRIRLSRRQGETPVWRILSRSAKLQGLLVDAGWRGGESRLVVRNGGGETAITAIPDAEAAWRTPLGEAMPFVRPASDNETPVSTAASRAMDKLAIERFGVPGMCLMENAAIDAVIVAADMVKNAGGGGPVLVLAGGGNNGGDGLAVARGLARMGIRAEAALLKREESLTGDAASNFRLLKKAGDVPIHRLHDDGGPLAELLASCSLAVDALLGTGFRGALSPAFARVVELVNAAGKPVLSLDLPSGLNGDGEATERGTIIADRTIAFAAVKIGCATDKGRRAAGALFVGDIGAPAEALGLT